MAQTKALKQSRRYLEASTAKYEAALEANEVWTTGVLLWGCISELAATLSNVCPDQHLG